MTPELAITKIQAAVRGNIARSRMLWPCGICKAEAPYYSMTRVRTKWRCRDCCQGSWVFWYNEPHYWCPCRSGSCEKGCRYLECGCVTTCKGGYHCPKRQAGGVHYCGDSDCEGTCGTLICGCIDVCRGRCGDRDYNRW